MSMKCEICGKGLQRGNRVSHAHNVSKRVWKPNLQRVRAIVDGKPQRIRVCTSCIKKGTIEKNARMKPQAEPTA
ncbi:MAG: 50S ribosomal protein L28 [Candidatus Eisenbacteria bacterium]|uniref:Large ribosomal subunit protein bL28 n=1 Tax=Eiseniibacteriota bacterium TaxID=2212470 RepID=A0A937XCF6_UNCEI|nr:50S ribosomal protein L28 [Candidatus Eisenbacteria bacterium]